MALVVRNQSEVWRGYRALRRTWAALWIGVIPFVLVLAELLEVPSRALGLLILAYCFAVAVVSIRVRAWRCPRCGKPFAQRRWKMASLWDLFPNRPCKHCGLVEGSDSWEES